MALRRLFKRLLVAVAILTVSYLVVANVLLRTRLLRNAVSGSVSFAFLGSSTDLRLDYRSAYSILPGKVHIDGLTIRGREPALEWALTLDHADVHISLADLFRHRFRATRLRSSGFTIRARLRLDRVDATSAVVAALPPIAGFADPPLLDEGPEAPPLTDATYHLWSVELDDVEVEHVREVWIQALRAEGDTHVRGRWLFRPQRWLDVGPATVEANGMDVFYGSAVLATGVRGSLLATVHPFDLRQAGGLQTLDHVSYDGHLGGRAVMASVLGLLAPKSGVRVIRWEGPFDARVVLDHGELADGTRVWSETTDVGVEARGLVFEGDVRTELGVRGDLATVDVRVSGLRVSGPGIEQASVASIAVAVTSRELHLPHPGGDARFTLDVGGATTNDLGAWQEYLPSRSTGVVRSGKVTADGRAGGSLVEDGGWAVGTATVAADEVAVALGPAVVAGNLVARIDLRRATWADERLDLSGSDLVLHDVSARSARTGVPVLVVASLTMVAPRLALAPTGVDGHVTIDLPRADLVHLRGMRDVVHLPAGLALEGGSGRAKLHAEVELGTGSIRGSGEVALRAIQVRAGSTELVADIDCALRARRTGDADGTTDLSGSTLAITHAGTGTPAPLADDWWASAALRQATLRTRGGLFFDGKAHVVAKDASPATALVSENSGVPAWAANIFRMPVLDANAQVRVAPASFEVRSLVARGGGTSVRAEYAKRNGRQDGAVLMSLGWTALGYDLADSSTGPVLVDPDAWFNRKVATLREVTQAKAEARAPR